MAKGGASSASSAAGIPGQTRDLGHPSMITDAAVGRRGEKPQISTGVVKGEWPIQGEEKTPRSNNHSLYDRCLFLCHPERSQGICGFCLGLKAILP
jgi:hypothetical protein